MSRSVLAVAALGMLAGSAAAQTVWSGYDYTFTKANLVDPFLPENQDRITGTVWITRANAQGIFNAFSETIYSAHESPLGTEWAFGVATDWAQLDFQPWQIAINSFPPGMVNQAMVVHLIDDDIYLDLMFTHWAGGAQGGAFSYNRAVPAPASGIALLPLLAFSRRRR